jgi:hypothetical protein
MRRLVCDNMHCVLMKPQSLRPAVTSKGNEPWRVYPISTHPISLPCGRFGLSLQDARAEFDRVVAIVRTWPHVFREFGVSARDMKTTAPAFLYDGLFAEAPVALPAV